jgi:putative ABC transport system permease protein
MGKMNVYQALVMGFAAFGIAVLCGLILTYIIVYAINYRSFGWSVDVHVNSWVFVKSFVLTMLACLVSALYPTYKLIREPARLLLTEE